MTPEERAKAIDYDRGCGCCAEGLTSDVVARVAQAIQDAIDEDRKARSEAVAEK